MLGDIMNVSLSGDQDWNVGKYAYLACTQGVTKELKRQGLGKALFSGEGMFVYKLSGVGIMWITSFGAIVKKDVSCASTPIFIFKTLDLMQGREHGLVFL
jgi:uncharacterized protein (AIM24 family)